MIRITEQAILLDSLTSLNFRYKVCLYLVIVLMFKLGLRHKAGKPEDNRRVMNGNKSRNTDRTNC